jgi:hypothetical protein
MSYETLMWEMLCSQQYRFLPATDSSQRRRKLSATPYADQGKISKEGLIPVMNLYKFKVRFIRFIGIQVQKHSSSVRILCSSRFYENILVSPDVVGFGSGHWFDGLL